jgi:hypothetical protein
MERRDVTITLIVPCDCTDDQFKEWVEFNTGVIGGISLTNPLCDYDLDADYVSIN